tara:strand:- start:2308 stop:2649 length:342 start_codon:yes stop_codon:yes gene_type:complete
MATFEPPPTYAEVVLFDEEGKKPRFNPIWLKWFVDIASYLSASGGSGGGVSHNLTTGLQGGQSNQFYHMTAAEDAALAAGLTVVITTAKLTALGATGTMTFTKGILTAQVAAT